MSELLTRCVEGEDCEQIIALLKFSFDNMAEEARDPVAMKEKIGKMFPTFTASVGTPEALATNYSEEKRKAGDAAFFVMVPEEDPSTIAGCCGCKRRNGPFELELVNLVVSPNFQRRGIAGRLVNGIFDFARDNGYQRVFLTCATPSAQQFYFKAMGFEPVSCWAPKTQMSGLIGYGFVKYLVARQIRKVAIMGGTHGNERLGVALTSLWQQHSTSAAALKYDSFDTVVLQGNLAAMKKNVRYCDMDLNQSFGPNGSEGVEALRAGELRNALQDVDYLIDLHSSTANMGTCLMCLATDVIHYRLAHHLIESGAVPDLRLLVDPNTRDLDPHVDSIVPSGIAFEVGPLSHGTIQYDMLKSLERVVGEALSFLQAHNTDRTIQHELNDGKEEQDKELIEERRNALKILTFKDPESEQMPEQGFRQKVKGYLRLGGINYPEDDPNCWVIHPERVGQDFVPISQGAPLLIHIGDPTKIIRWEEEKTVFPAFIGEAAYLERGMAMSYYEEKWFAVY